MPTMTSSLSLTPFLYQTRTIRRVSPRALGRSLSSSAALLEHADVFVNSPADPPARQGQIGLQTRPADSFYRNVPKQTQPGATAASTRDAEQRFFDKFREKAVDPSGHHPSPHKARTDRKRSRQPSWSSPATQTTSTTSEPAAAEHHHHHHQRLQPWWVKSQLESAAIAQPPAMGVHTDGGEDALPRFEFYQYEPGEYSHVTYPAATTELHLEPTDAADAEAVENNNAGNTEPKWTTRPDIQERDQRGDCHVPFDFEVPTTPGDDGHGDGVGGSAAAAEQRSPLSTLTRAERGIFEDIFDELVVTGHTPRLGDALTLGRGRAKSIHELNQDAQSALRYLVKDASYAANQGDLSASRTLVDQVRNATFRDRMLQKYPSSIRKVAAKTLGLHTNDAPLARTRLTTMVTAHGPADKPDMLLQRLKEMGVAEESVERERQAEWRRLKDMILDADTDKDLWNVLEEHVFSIPARVGVEDDESSLAAGADDAALLARPKKKQVHHKQVQQVRHNHDHHQHLDIDVYGPLYPALLIAAHRQLVRSFSPTSPLVYSLLPRVKALGLTSYVLGASSTLYNETMMLYWTHRGDLRTVLALLDEMEAAGLFADPHTEKLLKRINNTLSVCEGGRGGWTGFVPSMMTFGSFAAGIRAKLVHAHWKVREAIEQRGLELLA